MRRVITVFVSLLFILLSGSVVLADGISNEQTKNYPNVEDYRKFPVSNDELHTKPLSGFSIQVKTNDILSEETPSGGIFSIDGEISAEQDYN